MAVTSVQVKHAVDAESRAKFLRKIITYRVAVNSQTDGPDVITAATNVPKINLSTYASPFKYGSDSDNTALICREIRNLRKVVNWSGSLSVWELDAEFLYDRDQTTTAKGVSVTPLTRQTIEIVQVAQFKGWFQPKTDLTTNFDVEADTLIDDTNSPALKLDQIGPITNSAGTPVVPGVEETIGKLGLIVKWTRVTPVNYTGFLGRVNSAEINITDTHGNFDGTFAAGTLKLLSADQTPRDLFGITVYDVSLEFEEVEFEDDHFELDRGLGEFVDVGDDDGRGGAYDSTQDLPSNNMRPMTGADGQPISQPVPFNGKGKAIEQFEPNKARYLRYKKRPAVAFSLLGIGEYT